MRNMRNMKKLTSRSTIPNYPTVDSDEVILISFAEDASSIPTYYTFPSSTTRATSATAATAAAAATTTTTATEFTLLSFNNLLVASILIFAMLIVFPKGIRKRFFCRDTDNRRRNATKSSNPTSKAWAWMIDKTKRKEYYQKQKKVYDDLYPNGDRSLVDACSFQIAEEGGQSVMTNADSSSTSTSTSTSTNNTNSTTASTSNCTTNRNPNANTNSSMKMNIKNNHMGPKSSLLSSHGRRNYGSSMPVLDTNFVSTCSIQKAEDNEDLSPIGEFT